MSIIVAATTVLLVFATVIPLSSNAQQTITSIPSGMHKCISVGVIAYGFGIGLNASVGHNGNISKATDDVSRGIEGCILHWERLYPNG